MDSSNGQSHEIGEFTQSQHSGNTPSSTHSQQQQHQNQYHKTHNRINPNTQTYHQAQPIDGNKLHVKSLHYIASSIETIPSNNTTAPNATATDTDRTTPHKPQIESIPLYTTNVQLIGKVMETMIGFNPSASSSTLPFAKDASTLQNKKNQLYNSTIYTNYHKTIANHVNDNQLYSTNPHFTGSIQAYNPYTPSSLSQNSSFSRHNNNHINTTNNNNNNNNTNNNPFLSLSASLSSPHLDPLSAASFLMSSHAFADDRGSSNNNLLYPHDLNNPIANNNNNPFTPNGFVYLYNPPTIPSNVDNSVNNTYGGHNNHINNNNNTNNNQRQNDDNHRSTSRFRFWERLFSRTPSERSTRHNNNHNNAQNTATTSTNNTNNPASHPNNTLHPNNLVTNNSNHPNSSTIGIELPVDSASFSSSTSSSSSSSASASSSSSASSTSSNNPNNRICPFSFTSTTNSSRTQSNNNNTFPTRGWGGWRSYFTLFTNALKDEEDDNDEHVELDRAYIDTLARYGILSYQPYKSIPLQDNTPSNLPITGFTTMNTEPFIITPPISSTDSIFSRLNSASWITMNDLTQLQRELVQHAYNHSVFQHFNEQINMDESFGITYSIASNFNTDHDDSQQSNNNQSSSQPTLQSNNNSSIGQSYNIPGNYTIYGGFHMSAISHSLVTRSLTHRVYLNPSHAHIYNSLKPIVPSDNDNNNNNTTKKKTPHDSNNNENVTGTTSTSSHPTQTYQQLYGAGTLNLSLINVATLPGNSERLRSTLVAMRQKENTNLVLLEPYFSRLFAGKPSCIDRSDGVASITPRKLPPTMTKSITTYRQRVIAMKQHKMALYQFLLPWSILIQDGLNVLSLQHELNQLQLKRIQIKTKSIQKSSSTNTNTTTSTTTTTNTVVSSKKRRKNKRFVFDNNNDNNNNDTIQKPSLPPPTSIKKDKPCKIVKKNSNINTSNFHYPVGSCISPNDIIQLNLHYIPLPYICLQTPMIRWKVLPKTLNMIDNYSKCLARSCQVNNIIPTQNQQKLSNVMEDNINNSPTMQDRNSITSITSQYTHLFHDPTPYRDRFSLPQWLLQLGSHHDDEVNAWKRLFHPSPPTTTTDNDDITTSIKADDDDDNDDINNSTDESDASVKRKRSNSKSSISGDDEADLLNQFINHRRSSQRNSLAFRHSTSSSNTLFFTAHSARRSHQEIQLGMCDDDDGDNDNDGNNDKRMCDSKFSLSDSDDNELVEINTLDNIDTDGSNFSCNISYGKYTNNNTISQLNKQTKPPLWQYQSSCEHNSSQPCTMCVDYNEWQNYLYTGDDDDNISIFSQDNIPSTTTSITSSTASSVDFITTCAGHTPTSLYSKNQPNNALTTTPEHTTTLFSPQNQSTSSLHRKKMICIDEDEKSDIRTITTPAKAPRIINTALIARSKPGAANTPSHTHTTTPQFIPIAEVTTIGQNNPNSSGLMSPPLSLTGSKIDTIPFTDMIESVNENKTTNTIQTTVQQQTQFQCIETKSDHDDADNSTDADDDNDDFNINCIPSLPTQEQIDTVYHRENALGCSHYERACHIAASCCGRFYCCRYCHDAAESHAIIRKNIDQIVCMYCVLDILEAESILATGLHQLYEPAKHVFEADIQLAHYYQRVAQLNNLQHHTNVSVKGASAISSVGDAIDTGMINYQPLFANRNQPQQQKQIFSSIVPHNNVSFHKQLPALDEGRRITYNGAKTPRNNYTNQSFDLSSQQLSSTKSVQNSSSRGISRNKNHGNNNNNNNNNDYNNNKGHNINNKTRRKTLYKIITDESDDEFLKDDHDVDMDVIVEDLACVGTPSGQSNTSSMFKCNNYQKQTTLRIDDLNNGGQFLVQMIGILGNIPIHTSLPPGLAHNQQSTTPTNSGSSNNNSSTKLHDKKVTNKSSELIAKDECVHEQLEEGNTDEMIKKLLNSLIPRGNKSDNYELSMIQCILSKIDSLVTQSHFIHTQFDFGTISFKQIQENNPKTQTPQHTHISNLQTMTKPLQRIVSRQTCVTDLIDPNLVSPNFQTITTTPKIKQHHDDDSHMCDGDDDVVDHNINSFSSPPPTSNIAADDNMNTKTATGLIDLIKEQDEEQTRLGLTNQYIGDSPPRYYNNTVTPPAPPSIQLDKATPATPQINIHTTNNPNDEQFYQFQARCEQKQLLEHYQNISILQDRLNSSLCFLRASIDYVGKLPGATNNNDMTLQLQQFLNVVKHPEPSSIPTTLSNAINNRHNDFNTDHNNNLDNNNDTRTSHNNASNLTTPTLQSTATTKSIATGLNAAYNLPLLTPLNTDSIKSISLKVDETFKVPTNYGFSNRNNTSNNQSDDVNTPLPEHESRFNNNASMNTISSYTPSYQNNNIMALTTTPRIDNNNTNNNNNNNNASIPLSCSLSIQPPAQTIEDSLSVLTNSIIDMYAATIEPANTNKGDSMDDMDDEDDSEPAIIPFLAPIASNTLKSTWHGNIAGYDVTFLNNLGAFFVARAQYYQLFSVLIMQPLKQLLLDVNVYIEVLLAPRSKNCDTNITQRVQNQHHEPVQTNQFTDHTQFNPETTSQNNTQPLSMFLTPKGSIKSISKIDKTVTPTYYQHHIRNADLITWDNAELLHHNTSNLNHSQDYVAQNQIKSLDQTPNFFSTQIGTFLTREHTTLQHLLDFAIQVDNNFQNYTIAILSKCQILNANNKSKQGQTQVNPLMNNINKSKHDDVDDNEDENEPKHTVFDYFNELNQLHNQFNNQFSGPNSMSDSPITKPGISQYSIIPPEMIPLLPSHHLATVHRQYASQQPPQQLLASNNHNSNIQAPTRAKKSLFGNINSKSEISHIYMGSDGSSILPWSYSIDDLDHLFLQFYQPPASTTVLAKCNIQLPPAASHTSVSVLTNNKSINNSSIETPSQGPNYPRSCTPKYNAPTSSLPLDTILSPDHNNSFHTTQNFIEGNNNSTLSQMGQNTPQLVNAAVIALDLSQKPNQSCNTCLRTLARVYCDCCRLYDDKRGKAVTHCNLCMICRQGVPNLLTHCNRCSVCYNKRTLRSWFAEGKSGNVYMRNTMVASRCGRIYASLHISYPNDFDFTLTKGVDDQELLRIIKDRDDKIISKLEYWDYSWLPSTVIERLFHNCPFTPPSSPSSSPRQTSQSILGVASNETILFDPTTNAHVIATNGTKNSAVSFAKHDSDVEYNKDRDMNHVDINLRLKLVDRQTYSTEFKKEMVLKYYPYLGQLKQDNVFYSTIQNYITEQQTANPNLSIPNQNELCFPKIPLMNFKETHPMFNPLLRIRAVCNSAQPSSTAPTMQMIGLAQFGVPNQMFGQHFDPSGLPILLPTTLAPDIQQRFVDIDDNLTYPHICITEIMSTSCFICLQPLSQGNATISTLSCSHVLHSNCLKSFLHNNGTKCFCRKSISANPLYTQQIEAYLRADPHGLVTNVDTTISCNDCEISFRTTQYHTSFNQCKNCNSFNTFISNIGARISPPITRPAPTTITTSSTTTTNNNNNNNNAANNDI